MSATRRALQVREVVSETADARTFVLEAAYVEGAPVEYEAGQFLTLVLPWEGLEIRRCYSFCTAPGVDALPAITVKRVQGGRASNHLIDHIDAGANLLVEPAAGRFRLIPDTRAPLTLFAGGSGITPILSLAKAALAETERDVKLEYANRDANSIILQKTLDGLQAAYPRRFAVHHHLDDDAGFYTERAAQRAVARRVHGDVYVCGPAPFMDTVERGLQEAGVRPTRMFFERFQSPVDEDRRGDAPSDVRDEGPFPERFHLEIAGAQHDIAYIAGESLLECARRAGLRPPASCEDGFCGVCMGHVREGEVSMPRREALTESDLERGRVLLCQARPLGDGPLTIDYSDTAFTAGGGAGEMGTPLSPARTLAILALCVALVSLVRALH